MRYVSCGLAVVCCALVLTGCPKPVCTPGEVGCACRADGSCDQPGGPLSSVCGAANRCQPCVAGAQGCAPVSPKCFSPCAADLVRADGTFAACSSEGLLEGCLGDNTCVAGSCVAPGGTPPGCKASSDCPDYQACIGGGCYSECELDADCAAGKGCYRHVCRPSCTTASSSCAQGTACLTTDGNAGYCVDVAPPTGTAVRSVPGTFPLSTRALKFSNLKLTGSFELTNQSPVSREFKVRKVLHREYKQGVATLVTENPLHWLTLARDAETAAAVPELTVRVDPGAKAVIKLGGAVNRSLTRWDGALEISNAELGTQRVDLKYLERPEGQWQGKMTYFANFPSTGLDAWAQDRTSASALLQVENAFIQKWGVFKAGNMSVDELKAMIKATQLASWKDASVKKLCANNNDTVACYPYSNPQGYSVYSQSLSTYPIPTGATELPIAINLRDDPAGGGRTLIGRVVSADSLHENGNPGVRLTFETDPTACTPRATGVICPISTFAADVLVGGRYVTTSADTSCAAAPKDEMGRSTFTLARTPWLVPGFSAQTDTDPTSGLRYRYECRDKLLPDFVAANPIPDGRTRKRHLELVDGALINSEDLILIFKESFPSFLDGTDSSGFSAYGLMVLTRAPADLDPQAFTAGVSADSRTPPNGLLGVSCAPDLLKIATGSETFPAAPTTPYLDALADTLISGIKQSGGPPAKLLPADPVKAHYFCEDTGLFDGGPLDKGASPHKVACPAGSRVQFFTLGAFPASPGPTQDEIANLPCQQAFAAGTAPGQVLSRGTCQQLLNTWKTNRLYNLVLDPVWRCSNPNQAYCSLNRLDLRADKDFFPATQTSAAFLPLRTEVENAFRYKTRFRNRQGKSVGFAPQICPDGSDAVPYCYDPASIERAQRRVDCAVALYTGNYAQLSADVRGRLQLYLKANFSFESEIDPTLPLPVIHDGYERLNAELLIMMGDESYTRAFSSRFDLAGSSIVSFEGRLFEPDGIDLSGGAGYELYSLYQAVQYYQQALDRFYSLSPRIWTSIGQMGTGGFINKDTVVSYFDRLIRASSQKSRAWSEIARRYQSFNRADLARRVVERSYAAAYLESIVLSRVMLKLGDIVQPEDRPQLVERVEFGQLVYSSALLAMRESYAAITDSRTLFGFQPDYIPFPALEEMDSNAFEKVLTSAKAQLAVASAKEDLALGSSRAFETDSAAFQSELVSVRNNYENQLAAICGTFTGTDGRVYPAVPKYAYLNERAKLIGNPCGLAGNGELFAALTDVDKVVTDFAAIRVRFENLKDRIALEKQRVRTQCDLLSETVEYQFKVEDKVGDLETVIQVAQAAIDYAKDVTSEAVILANLGKCMAIVGTAAGTDCPQAGVGIAAYEAAARTETFVTIGANIAILAAKREISNIQRDGARWVLNRPCDYATVDSNAKVADMVLGFKELEIEAYAAELDLSEKLGRVQSLRNTASRTIAEQSETEQLAINFEVARNDPNVRIYKNDAILTADRTFQAAVGEAYRATKVFEYYTSQSYAHLGDLFLVRLASRGDISLEAYLARLEHEFRSFQEAYGNPDQRVAIISLRDDVLAVPRLRDDSTPLSDAERLELFRAALTDARRLDENGYLTFPFSTSFGPLSPLTRNHKIHSIEAELVGADTGDAVGRLYLRQKGTGVVRALPGDKSFYAFPVRTAVLNPFFNGERVFSGAVYRNDRLRDRPFVNTHWELVLNQKDEQANKDINLRALSDVRLYVTYTDFTSLQ